MARMLRKIVASLLLIVIVVDALGVAEAASKPSPKKPPPKKPTARPPPPRRSPSPRPTASPIEYEYITVNRTLAGEVSIVSGHYHQESKQNAPLFTRIGVRELAIGNSTEDYARYVPVILPRKDGELVNLNVLTGDTISIPVTVKVPVPASRCTRRRALLERVRSRSLSELVDEGALVDAADFDALDVTATGGPKDLIVGGKPVNLTSMTIIISYGGGACTQKNTVTEDKLRAAYFNKYAGKFDGRTSATHTVERYFDACTYNKLMFKEVNNLITSVTIPCNGSYPNSDWRNPAAAAFSTSKKFYNFQSCADNCTTNGQRNDETWAWIYHGVQRILQLKRSVTSFKRILVIVPPSPLLRWSGLGQGGCPVAGTTCPTWIKGSTDGSVDVPTVVQELMHNTGLYHSNRIGGAYPYPAPSIEYGDPADFMGRTYSAAGTKKPFGIVCAQAPQMFKAGWANPIPGGEIKLSSIMVGKPLSFTLPATSTTDKNFVRIVMGPSGASKAWVSGANVMGRQRSIFLSYRSKAGPPPAYDAGLGTTGTAPTNEKVYIHESGTTTDYGAGKPTADPWYTTNLLVGMLASAPIKLFPYKRPTAPFSTWSLSSLNSEFNVSETLIYNATRDPVHTSQLAAAWVSPLYPGEASKGLIFKFTLSSRNVTHAIVNVCRMAVVKEDDEQLCNNNVDDDCDGVKDDKDPDCEGLTR